jgi:IPT/TIG domain-containing protein
MRRLPNETSSNALLSVSLLLLVVVALSGCSSSTTSSGGGTTSSPNITSLSPTSGPVGAVVTVSGANFGATQGSSTIKFAGTTGTPTSWSGTSIVVAVPSGAATGNVVVIVGGTSSNGMSFTVTQPAPSISSVTPISGPVGTSVTITGTNFGATQGTSTVTFNGIASKPTSWSPTSIASPVPAGATTGNVVITVGGQASNAVSFTVTAAGLSITGLNPTSGTVGTSVTITGANFGTTQGSSTVTFNGTAATVTSWSATSIATIVPTGATTGNVVITVGGQASNAVSFTVTAAGLSITGLNPTAGPVGTSVTITGTNFGATQGTSTVAFNGTAATVTSWSATNIVTTVPAGATTGTVVVSVGGQNSNGVTFTVGSTTNISVTVSPVRGGATVNQQIALTAAVANDLGAAGVNWGATAGGTLTGQTTTAASFSSSAAGVYTITATSVANNSKSATATISVTDLPGVYTYHNDLSRDGANTQEYALTTANVNTSSFGKLFSCTVDGAIYAQPLWVANLMVNGATHNAIFVATEHESVYAFDADASPCVQLWHVSLIDGAHGATTSGGNPLETSVPAGTSGNLVGNGSGLLQPEVGVTGTPVIDPSTNTLYVSAQSVNVSGPTFYQRLHAIDLATGDEKFGGPANITSSSVTFPGTGDGGATTHFNSQQENQRPGLVLLNGIVYVAWASHEDNPPYYGWVVGYNASTLGLSYVLNVSPNVGYGGIWMSGAAPAADSSNNLYLITGNAVFDVTNASAPNNDYGDSFLKLASNLTVSQYFTPSDESTDNSNDFDFGSGGAAVLVDLPTNGNNPTHLVVGGGKDGYLYLLNRDKMGGLGDSNSLQRFSVAYDIFSTAAFWNNNLYIAGVQYPLYAYQLNTSTVQFGSATSQSSEKFGYPGATPSVSATGTTNAIVWALDTSASCISGAKACGPSVLRAYDATDLSHELWNSSTASGDAAGNAVKFTVPTVANGKVYVGTRGNNTGGVYGSTSVSGELDVYGLKPN